MRPVSTPVWAGLCTDSQPVDVSSLGAQVMQLATDPSFISFGAACPSGDLFAQGRAGIGLPARRP